MAERMATALFDVMSGEKAPWRDFYVTAALGELLALEGVLFSGGVSEYIYGRENRLFGDLGPYLGHAVKAQAEKRGFRIIESNEGIRATVIGASQYTVQLSGETIFVPESGRLPIRNLRVFAARVDWEVPVADRAREATKRTVNGRDPEVCDSPFALLFTSPPFVGYGAAQELARGIDQALAELTPDARPQALVFEQNVGRVVGGILSPKWSLPCIDEVTLSELDFIDIGQVVEGEAFVPVVIKSLAFGV
jgi:ethanolamine utilization protein EutA